ncbi:MAG: hypothetical protein ABW007_27325 [Chitinophagaceae bacterium]
MSQLFLILIFQPAGGEAGWAQAIQYGPTVVLLLIILGFLVRIAPMWKEIRLKEIDMRGEENVVKREMAGALTQLATALKDIAVEQRRATEEVSITQRVNSDMNERLAQNVQSLNERLDRVENLYTDEGRQITKQLLTRMDDLEKHVQPQSTTA